MKSKPESHLQEIITSSQEHQEDSVANDSPGGPEVDRETGGLKRVRNGGHKRLTKKTGWGKTNFGPTGKVLVAKDKAQCFKRKAMAVAKEQKRIDKMASIKHRVSQQHYRQPNYAW